MRDPDTILKTLDWEGFEFPLTLQELKLDKDNYSFEKETIIEVWRDIDLKLTGKIKGLIKHPANLEYKNDEPLKRGVFVKGINISCKSNDTSYLLRGCLIDNPSYRPQRAGELIPFQAELIIDSIVRTSEKESEVKTIIDWHVCSSRTILFPRTTSRYSDMKPYKFRSGIDKEQEIDEGNLLGFKGVARDFFLLQVDKLVIIIQKISESFLPKWAGGIAIEYRSDISIMPSPAIREKIAEFISFIFGFQLLNIGSTHYNSTLTD